VETRASWNRLFSIALRLKLTNAVQRLRLFLLTRGREEAALRTTCYGELPWHDAMFAAMSTTNLSLSVAPAKQ
jgi:hypothetical protein